MTPNYTTIITPIIPGREDQIRQYLRTTAEPRPVGDAKPHGCGVASFLQCQPLFRFDRIMGLHFCSFALLSDDGEFGPRLIFEATFDGPRSDFLHELWQVAPQGLHDVYKLCAGYPRSGLAVPELIEEYLVRHDAGAHTFFSGCPGRSVTQIRGENGIRRELVKFLSGRRAGDNATQGTLPDLQQTVRRDFVRQRPENRWAEQLAVTPWEIANRMWVVVGALLAAVTLLCGLGALVVRWAFGMGPFALRDWMRLLFKDLWRSGVELTNSASPWLGWLGALISELQLPVLNAIIFLAVAWFAVRITELILRSMTEDPRDQYFMWRFPLHLLVILKYALPVFLVGFAALGLVGEKSGTPSPESIGKPSSIKTYMQKVDGIVRPPGHDAKEQKVDQIEKPSNDATAQPGLPSRLVSFFLLLGIGLVWLVLRHWATSLKLAVQFQELSATSENWRRFLLDVIRFAMVIAAVTAVLIVARHIPAYVATALADAVRPWIYGFLVFAAYLLVGILTFYAAALVLFFAVRGRELADLRRFKSAEDLTTRPLDNLHAYAREEGGINRYQNHLASLTYVKPGLLRRVLVRVTLFVVNLLSRFWFNQGHLGGIPTIMSARWVLIDGGRRLLFLDNFGGAWDSYLNEFIDMGAVKGLNAIWSNTFIKAGDPREQYAWPEARFYFWKGAQAERPFKAYVRQSQIETIVWYGAYPTLSITNINMNTDLRQSLFKPLAPCDLDQIIQRL